MTLSLDLPLDIRSDVPLATETTLGVGGAARSFASAMTPSELVEALTEARNSDQPVFVLGGGSNVVIADAGFDGMVVRVDDYRIEVEKTSDGRARLTVGAGVEWDELVEFCCTERFAGLECLSGIPGRVGAAPIQNIGAYGQEVAERLTAVRVLDRATHSLQRIPAAECGFGYRSSHFKGAWRDRYVVVGVELDLEHDGAPTLRYAELRDALGVVDGGPLPELHTVREIVLRIRRRKAMVVDPDEPNSRSAGSFFVNPVVSRDEAARVRSRLDTDVAETMPSWPTDDGRVKLSAGWLIERAGFAKGFAFGRAGLSERHALAIINRGEARATDIVALASLVRRGVRNAMGITLVPEPVFVGFDATVDELLH